MTNHTQEAITVALEACYQEIGITNPSPAFDARIRKLAATFLRTYRIVGGPPDNDPEYVILDSLAEELERSTHDG